MYKGQKTWTSVTNAIFRIVYYQYVINVLESEIDYTDSSRLWQRKINKAYKSYRDVRHIYIKEYIYNNIEHIALPVWLSSSESQTKLKKNHTNKKLKPNPKQIASCGYIDEEEDLHTITE